ncbi:GIY-YIG nuclease family protein [Tenacibaculum finnmarkense]|uniref:GIY-YIG nuclease family protein n=1 Tax=Tenacibaculum finnmarkense TaxID=2781243 RepID=UPI001EFB223D|nr:GIY-YIG nuclease family protein [Tenacibaculum finnmarkense]MCG8206269.1 GIY-YIG nuclease family protein [Tenacibaculum finnmarkense genomovar finnmarkense]MCG8722230.1 GIY-YIG nuclease family protein [Tenacibaculum finnmarkense]MCG8740639.1 GIY-YIG nuclease family protein [Tenacibaculum finnmarkense]MCG8763898.1 GIY-YIG nuclease family protein [Tenacibaculum finnmarkense]MCG8776701.1 GIY-YIG nuclease family protein [Tenacibaculum finnmarkense]
MKKFGKTIKLFLIDGEPNGRMTCELSNWTGKAYKIPRIMIKDSYTREDLQSTGIYLLFGKNEEGKGLVYIGETETIIERLKKHVIEKEFWTEVILFISKDENLNKAHIKYLESRLYEITKKVNNYKLDNSSIPSKASISESEIAEMEEFIENIKLLTNTLGHRVFESLVNIESSKNEKKNLFLIKAARGANGFGVPSSKGFIIFKGSDISKSTVDSMPKSLINVRQKLIENKTIIETEKSLTFSKDYEFSSPSLAAAILMGRNANGLKEWKLKNGKTLKEYETNQ